MKNSLKRSILPLLGTVSLGAPVFCQANVETGSVLDLWNTPEIFIREFFPEAESLSADDIFIEGLKSYFPNRVYRENPEPEPLPEREPRVEDMMAGVRYVRVYNVTSALPVLERQLPNGAAVIDLRNVYADRDEALRLGSLLALNETVSISLEDRFQTEGSGTAGRTLTIDPAGIRRALQPVFILTNRDTAGPIEAVLAELKNKGQIISIGTPTAGNTGAFRQVMEDPSLFVLSGELRPGSGGSIRETGFIPSVSMTVSDDDDRKAYEAMEEGKSLRALVRSENDRNGEEFVEGMDLQQLLESNNESSDEGVIVDLILQRAYFIATALKSIGKISAQESN